MREKLDYSKFALTPGEPQPPRGDNGLDRSGNPCPGESPACVCKKDRGGHYVLFCVSGSSAGSMVDPAEENAAGVRPEAFAFRKVSPEVFEEYRKFLLTGNRFYLRQAGRMASE